MCTLSHTCRSSLSVSSRGLLHAPPPPPGDVMNIQQKLASWWLSFFYKVWANYFLLLIYKLPNLLTYTRICEKFTYYKQTTYTLHIFCFKDKVMKYTIEYLKVKQENLALACILKKKKNQPLNHDQEHVHFYFMKTDEKNTRFAAYKAAITRVRLNNGGHTGQLGLIARRCCFYSPPLHCWTFILIFFLRETRLVFFIIYR